MVLQTNPFDGRPKLRTLLQHWSLLPVRWPTGPGAAVLPAGDARYCHTGAARRPLVQPELRGNGIERVSIQVNRFGANDFVFSQSNGDLNLARRCLRLCVGIDGAHGAALNNLAVLAARCGQQDRARSYLAAAKSVLPGSEEVTGNIVLMDAMKSDVDTDDG